MEHAAFVIAEGNPQRHVCHPRKGNCDVQVAFGNDKSDDNRGVYGIKNTNEQT